MTLLPRDVVAGLVLLTMVAAVQGCAGTPQLYWQGGDTYSPFEAAGRAPTPVDCTGTTEERFACFADLTSERVGDTSGTLAVVTADGALLETSTTEPGQGAPTTSDTLFPLLSVTKMFTAATAVLLASEGLLDLHQSIATYLPELGADDLGRVTLHQLLTHTAGLVDDPRQGGGYCVAGGELSDAVAHAHVGAPAGAVFLYSNVGYSLAGLVIARVTSRPFEEVVRDRVLLPMGMTSATFRFASVQVQGHPQGAGDGSRCPLVAPAGGLNASARDMARWARAMSEPGSHPLGEAVVTALTTPHVETGVRPGEAYGYGVSMTRRGDVWVYHHSGGVQDFSAFVAWVPTHRLGAAAMMNATHAAGATPAAVVLRGLSVLLDLPHDWRSTSDGSPRPASTYVGTYLDSRSWLGRVRVRLDGEGRLVLEYVDGPPALLPPTLMFHVVPGEDRARFVVTAVGIAERVPDGL